jgi:REP element-mobilizing transposase RayT
MPTPQEIHKLQKNIPRARCLTHNKPRKYFSVMEEARLKIYHRMLPHWELDGASYFITFNTWEKLELNPEAREIVLNSCLFFNNQSYKIFVFVVMIDHVHLLVQPLLKSENEYWSLSSIMSSIKGYSAKQIPKVMKHIGTVWQDERYDRIVRNEEEFQAYWQYIRQNPVEAGLSSTPEDYPFLWQTSE